MVLAVIGSLIQLSEDGCRQEGCTFLRIYRNAHGSCWEAIRTLRSSLEH